MSNGKIAGIAIGTLAIGIAIGFFIPTDSGIEQTAPVPMMQTESVDYGIDKITFESCYKKTLNNIMQFWKNLERSDYI